MTFLPALMVQAALAAFICEVLSRDLKPLATLVFYKGVSESHPDRIFTQAVIELTLSEYCVAIWMERLIQTQLAAAGAKGALKGKVPFAQGNAYLAKVRSAIYAAARILANEREEALGPVGRPTLHVSFKSRNVQLGPKDRLSPMVRAMIVEDYSVDQRSAQALEWLDSLGSVTVVESQGDMVSGHEQESLIPMSLFNNALREAREYGFADAYDPNDYDHLMELASFLELNFNRELAFRIRSEIQASGTLVQARTYFLPDSDIPVASEYAWHKPSEKGEYVGTVHLPYRSRSTGVAGA
ncbi:hypothetical protein [Deinococcus xinjiangensis]|uniref:hypothetical protein n=1 Tax=Deinococcus xinjiangensis TaxID=457454 RepID=UPI00336569A2